MNNNNTKTIDKLNKARGIFKINNIIKKKTNYHLQITGLFVFVSIFVIFIPILLYKTKHYTILEGYLPNVDLIATALSWHGGSFEWWKQLYPASPITNYGFASQVFINYIALLGVTYIIARETKKTRNVIKGWSLGFIMLLMTYLLPSNATIIPVMEYLNNKLNNNSRPILYRSEIIATVGLIIAFIIIYLESLILNYFQHLLYKVGKFIIRIPKLF